MLYGLTLNGAMALGFMICVLYCLGDLETALTTPTGYPIIQVIYGATQSKAVTNVFMAFIIFNGMVAMFSSLASVSRLTWAFASDNGLPFSAFFGEVHPTLRVPLNSLALVAIIIILLQLVNIGSSTALFAILGVSTIGLYLSYILPVVFIILAKLRGDNVQYGPFKMGRWFGLAVNVFAVVYGIFVTIWLPFPPYLPVTSTNMNYAGPIIGGVLIFTLLDYIISGRKRFVTPIKPGRAYQSSVIGRF
jgi:choline transport protein